MDRKDSLIYGMGIVVMLACLSISLAACNLPHFWGGQPSAKKLTPTSTIVNDLTPTSTISSGSTPTSTISSGSTPTSTISSGSTPTSTISSGSTPTSTISSGSTPISTNGHGSTPISTNGQGSTPISTNGQGSTPISTNGHGSTPISTNGQGSTPTAIIGQGSTPISTNGHGSTPTATNGQGSTPTATNGHGSTPISTIGHGSTPTSTTVSSSAKSCGTLRYQQVGNNTGPILAESNKYVRKVVNCFLQAFKYCAPASIEMNVSIGAARINPASVSNVRMFSTKLPADGGVANLYQFTISSQSGSCVVSEVEQAYSVVAPTPSTPQTCAQVEQTRTDLRFGKCGNAGTITFPLAKTTP